MATSSKVVFKLDQLREQAVAAIDDRIAAKVVEVESHHAPAHEAQVREWRARQETRISELFRRLGGDDLPNAELADFRIDRMPNRDGYSRERAERELQSLQARRGKIIAKSAALVPDEDGNIALTKTQLQEFFDL